MPEKIVSVEISKSTAMALRAGIEKVNSLHAEARAAAEKRDAAAYLQQLYVNAFVEAVGGELKDFAGGYGVEEVKGKFFLKALNHPPEVDQSGMAHKD